MKINIVKTLVIICTVSTSGIAQVSYDSTWNHSIEINAGEQDFSGTNYYAYSTLVYETSKSNIKDLIANEVEARTGTKTKGKKVTTGEQIQLPGYEDKDVKVFAKTADARKMKDAVEVSVAFIHQDKAVSPQSYPEADKDARELVYNLGVLLNKTVVQDQIDVTERELELLNKKNETVQKQYAGIQEDIDKAEEHIRDTKADQLKLEAKMTSAQAESAALEALSKSSTADSKDLKKYASAKDKAMKMEDKYLKSQEDIAKFERKVGESKVDLLEKQDEVEEYATNLKQTTSLLAALRQKYDAIK